MTIGELMANYDNNMGYYSRVTLKRYETNPKNGEHDYVWIGDFPPMIIPEEYKAMKIKEWYVRSDDYNSYVMITVNE